MTSAAWAQKAPDAGVTAISNKRRSLPANISGGYFQSTETAAPRSGVNGGAYQHFVGTSGGGGIYWSPTTGAHHIYGDIFEFFGDNGHEQGIGYPTIDPKQGQGPCKAGTVMHQTFSKTSAPVGSTRTSVMSTTLCLRSNGVVERSTTFLTTADGGAAVSDVSRGGSLPEDDGRSSAGDDILTPVTPTPARGGSRSR